MKINSLNMNLGGAALVCLLAAVSCGKEQLENNAPESGTYAMTVSAGCAENVTRTVMTGDGTTGNPYATVWSKDDVAGLYVGDDGNVKMTVESLDGARAVFKGELGSKPAAGEKVYFYSPWHDSGEETVQAKAVACPFPYAQNPSEPGTYDPRCDYMWGNTAVGEDGAVSLDLKYAVGFINFRVKGLSGNVFVKIGDGTETLTADDKVKTVSIEAKPAAEGTEVKLVGDFTMNLEDGACTVPDRADGNNVGPKVLVNCPEGTTLGTLDIHACVHPFSLTSPDDVLKFWIQTENHYIIREVKVSELGMDSFSLAAGQLKAFDVTVDAGKWTVSVNPYRGGVIRTPEQFLIFVQDVKDGSYLDGKQTIGGNQYAALAPDAKVENRGIEKWLDGDGVAKLGNDITITKALMSTYGNLASMPLWTRIFDGQGHTVNFEDGTLLRPMFANVFKTGESNPGIVRNLKVAGNMTSAQVPYTQGTCPLIGILHDGEIDSCTSDVNIEITSYNSSLDNGNIALAGICRTMQGGRIKDCVNNGKIVYRAANTGNSNQSKLVNAVYAGGIVALVGKNYGTGAFGTDASADEKNPFAVSPVISGCSNNGNVSLTNTSAGTAYNWMQYSAAGGIVAWVWGGNETEYLSVDGCHNKGSISVEQSARGNSTSGMTGVGGIIGRAAPAGRMGSTLGPVYGSLDAAYWQSDTFVSECQEGFYLSLNNSDNSGSISASNRISQGTKFFHKIGCGGIAGILFGGYEGKMAEITGCSNTGVIVGCSSKAAKTEASDANSSGGIVGFGGGVSIRNCTNRGNIGEGGYNLAAAGIMGAAYQKFAIADCSVNCNVIRLNAKGNSVFGSLVVNYIHNAGLLSRKTSYAYEGSSVTGCKINGTVSYTKNDAATVSTIMSKVSDTPDTQAYCVLGNEDLTIAAGAYKLGYITISGTTHLTE